MAGVTLTAGQLYFPCGGSKWQYLRCLAGLWRHFRGGAHRPVRRVCLYAGPVVHQYMLWRTGPGYGLHHPLVHNMKMMIPCSSLRIRLVDLFSNIHTDIHDCA
jgi:hypothetical protein